MLVFPLAYMTLQEVQSLLIALCNETAFCNRDLYWKCYGSSIIFFI